MECKKGWGAKLFLATAQRCVDCLLRHINHWLQVYSAAGFSSSFNFCFRDFFFSIPLNSNPVCLFSSRNTAETWMDEWMYPTAVSFLWFPLVSASLFLWVSVSVIKVPFPFSSPFSFPLVPLIAIFLSAFICLEFLM